MPQHYRKKSLQDNLFEMASKTNQNFAAALDQESQPENKNNRRHDIDKKNALQVQRLELLGLDHKKAMQTGMNGYKNNLDQMHDKDIFQDEQKKKTVFRRYQQ